MVSQPKDGVATDDIVDMIRKRIGFNELRPERYQLEDAALIQLAYWSGKQQFQYENRLFVDTSLEVDPDVARYQVNLIRSRVLNAVARVVNVNAKFSARPEGASARDRELAKLSDKVFDHIRVVTDFEYTRALAELWAAICGTSYLFCEWDPLIGEPDRFYKVDARSSAIVPEFLLSPQAKVEKDRNGLFADYPTGDLRVSVESPFAVYQDTASRDAGVAGCRWIARRHWVDAELIAARFDMDVKDIPIEEPTQGVRNYDEAIAFMSAGIGLAPFAWTVPPDKLGKRTCYTEMWERPSREHRRGRRICMAGTKALNKDRRGGLENPYAGDRSSWAHLPFVKVDWMTHPGRWWGASLVEDMIPAQYNLNYARALKIQFMRDRGLPDTFVGDNSNLDTDNMRAGGGKIYKVSETSRHGVMSGPVPQMPTEVAQLGNELLGDLNMVAAQQEIEGSSLPGQMRSGAAIRAINEDRYMPLSVPASLSVRAARDAGRVLLAIGKLYYGPNRLMRYLDDGADWIVEEFDGASLVCDLQIVGMPSVSDTVNSDKADMLDALQARAFDPTMDEETQDIIMSALHYKAPAEFMRRKLQAKRHAEEVVHKLMADPTRWAQTGYPVFEWQDHVREAREVVAFMYTTEFERADIVAQGLITKYWKDCLTYIQAAQMAQMEAEAALKGTPGEKGQASQPAS